MKINNISFASNNITVQPPKNKMTMSEKIETFREMKDACLGVALLTSGISFLKSGEFFEIPKNRFLRWGVFGLALAGFTGMILESVYKHKYHKETDRVFNA